jgi:uncharacterized membrane protein (DUF373 family)
MGVVLHAFERAVILALTVLMMVVVALSIVELTWILVLDVITEPILLLEVGELLELFGLFLLVLIGLELLETIKAYLKQRVIHVEVVLEIAVIALARKIIVLELSNYSGITVLGLAALVGALALAFYLLRVRRRPLEETGE